MGKTITRPPILEQLRSANPTQSYTIQGQKANHNTRVYNEQWILQRHGYKTPAQVRREKLEIQYAEAAG